MKEFALVLFLGILVLVAGCAKGPTGPEEPHYTLEASETIGSEGGDLTVDDFSLSVPAGAFDSDVELQLYVSEDDQPYGEYGASRTFRIDGIPDDYHKPLHLKIKYQGTLSGEAYIAIGEEALPPSLGEVTTAYRLFQATDSSGYLIYDLPASESSKGKSPGIHKTSRTMQVGGLLNWIKALVVDDVSRHEDLKWHFSITGVGFTNVEAESLLNYLEKAYETFQDMEFSYEGREKWPMRVNIRDLSPWNAGALFVVPHRKGPDHVFIEISNKGMGMGQWDGMRIGSGHEFFHFVQYLYDLNATYDNYWLDEATAVWSEEKFTEQGPENYTPGALVHREMEPFKGMQKDKGDAPETFKAAGEHGYGMCAVIKYLLTRYGEDKLLKIYEEIKNDGAHPVDAIISNTESPVAWLEPFFREYLLGNIYPRYANVYSKDFWWDKTHGDFKIDSEDDTLKTYSYSFPDLSARLFRVLLDYPTIDSTAKITFKAPSDLRSEVTVFKFRYDPSLVCLTRMEYIDNSIYDVTVPELRVLTDDDLDLLFLVTNTDRKLPYTGSRYIDLEIRVTKEQELPKYGYASISLVHGQFKRVYPDGDTLYLPRYVNVDPMYFWKGSFSENTFTANWDTTDYYGIHYVGTMTIALNDARDMATQFSVTNRKEGAYTPEQPFVLDVTFSGVNIPVVEGFSPYAWGFEVEGEQVCGHITSLDYWYEQGGLNPFTSTLESYSCDSDSKVSVELWFEDPYVP